jgi:hypothetical protein
LSSFACQLMWCTSKAHWTAAIAMVFVEKRQCTLVKRDLQAH